MDTWCFYGEDRGKPWANISLWRPLCLLAQILDSDIAYVRDKNELKQDCKSLNHSKPNGDLLVWLDQWINENADNQIKQKELLRTHRGKRIRSILINHFRSSEIFGNVFLPTAEIMANNVACETLPEGWATGWQIHDYEKRLNLLTIAILRWLTRFNKENWRIFPVFRLDHTTDESKHEARQLCYIRRLHGSSLMHEFWQELEIYKEIKKSQPILALTAVKIWLKVLARYWNCGRKPNPKRLKSFDLDEHKWQDDVILPREAITQNYTRLLLLECPIIRPYAPREHLTIYQIANYLAGVKDMTPAAKEDFKHAKDYLEKAGALIDTGITFAAMSKVHQLICQAYQAVFKILQAEALKDADHRILVSLLFYQFSEPKEDPTSIKWTKFETDLQDKLKEKKNSKSISESNVGFRKNKATKKNKCINDLIPDLYELWVNARYGIERFAMMEGLETPYINKHNYINNRDKSAE